MTVNKKTLIARIVVWAAIGVLAVVLLIWAAGGGNISGWFVHTITNGKADAVIRTEEIREDVDHLDIEWSSGNIRLTPVDGEGIRIVEKASDPDRDTRLTYKVENGMLTVESDDRVGFSLLRWNRIQTDLEITVPRTTYERIVVDATSGTCDLSGLTAGEILVELTSGTMILDGTSAEKANIDLTSGEIQGSDVDLKTVEIELTSGKMTLGGKLYDVSLKVTSGNSQIRSSVLPDRLDAKTTSGDMTFWLPEGQGFSFDLKITSGDFSSDFPLVASGDRRTYLSGGPQYHLSCTSGDLDLRIGR
ncbi:MAG: DUF4097 domain-containing protein [Clostridiaceae bacterium]|nr:DUF4097 domain-containing protein [Clostridiaceae bacterium]